MMKFPIFLLAGVLAISCSHNDADSAHNHTPAHDHDHDHSHDQEQAKAVNETGHEAEEILLSPEMAEKFDIEVQEVIPQTFMSSIPVSGQIVDTPNNSALIAAPTSGIVKYTKGLTEGASVSAGATLAVISASDISGGDVNVQAQAALEAAKSELDRITPLYEQKLVTAKAYTDALQAYKQAKGAFSQRAASGRANTPIAGVITNLLVQEGQYVEVGTPIASVSSLKYLTLRADLPQRYRNLAPDIANANIVNPVNHEVYQLSSLGGKRIASQMAATSQRGYVPLYFTFDNNGEFAPGEIVKVYLLSDSKENAISVPLTTISEQQGAFFVYRQLDEEGYEKVPVVVGRDDGINVEILNGINPGDRIVTKNVVALRLAEGAKVVPQGHTHNH